MTNWRKSSYSGGENWCVETARLGKATVGIRDSKNLSTPPLEFSPREFKRFIKGLK